MTSLLLFDGVCNLCNGFVQFVIARDPAGRFQFAPLQSAAAARVLRDARVGAPLPDTVVLVENGRTFTRSTAALRVARGLRAPWPLAYACIIVPRPVRDWMYDFVARHRYRWFGKKDARMVPTPDVRDRFLTDELYSPKSPV